MKLFLSVLAGWMILIAVSAAEMPALETSSVVKVNDISRAWTAGGAIEHAKLVLDEIWDNPDYARVLVDKPSLKDRAYGSASPTGWKSYTSQDATSSWKGPGLAAYALWS